MMGAKKRKIQEPEIHLSQEQEELLELYLARLDEQYEELRENEKMQVEIETLHLKRILTK